MTNADGNDHTPTGNGNGVVRTVSPTTRPKSPQLDIGADSMLAFSHVFVRMYARINEGKYIVACSVTPDGQRMSVKLLSRESGLWEAEFGEADVSSMKAALHPSMSWGAFFELLQRSFAEAMMDFDEKAAEVKVTVKHDRATEAIPLQPFMQSVQVPVTAAPKGRTGVTLSIVEGMISFVSLRSGDKRESERLDAVIKQEAVARDEATRIALEVDILTATIARDKAVVLEADRRTKLLAEQLRATPEAAGWEQECKNPEVLARALCRIGDPLAAPLPGGGSGVSPTTPALQGLNVDLLRALKSPYCTASEKSSVFRCHSLVKPWPVLTREGDLADFMANQPPVVAQAYTLLTAGVEDWAKFDVFAAEELLRPFGGGALFFLGYALLWRCGSLAALNMDERTLVNFLLAIEAGYRKASDNVTFHTAVHAADVLHAVWYVAVHCEGLKKFRLTDVDIFTVLFAAICHDYDHPGLNNTFFINSRHPLAILYADRSVLENMHAACVLELTGLPQYNIFDGLTDDVRVNVASSVVELILATDMKQHADFMEAFRQRSLADDCDYSCRGDQVLAMCIVLKAADVSNCAKPESLSLRWAEAIMQEYSVQTQREEELGLRPTQELLAGSSPESVRARGQLGFINNVAMPLFAHLAEQLPRLQRCGEHVGANKTHWLAKANTA